MNILMELFSPETDMRTRMDSKIRGELDFRCLGQLNLSMGAHILVIGRPRTLYSQLVGEVKSNIRLQISNPL